MNEDTKTSAQNTAPRKRSRHSLQGSVISAGRDKTVTVLVERKIKHPLYKKYIRRSTKLHAHDENNECRLGDSVVIEACRPISKLKHWRLVQVVGKAA
ncbi:MAG: 30S ribosomal protein S17 [Gammaproteobacteria bacterium]|nr:30S ribosomal protein S17 [Gammaproteobacteria bacterium]MDA7970741.1 30S ribosomal protein S17 [Gammaproteobacteria bacterium]